MTIDQEIHVNLSPQDYALLLLEPIYQLQRDWVRRVGTHIDETCERDEVDSREAIRRFKLFALLTAGKNQYDGRNIAQMFSDGHRYEDILSHSRKTYGGIESVREWLNYPDAKKELAGNGIKEIGWF